MHQWASGRRRAAWQQRRRRRWSPRRSRPAAARLARQVNDISLEDYIAVKPKYARFTTHSAGRFQKRRFRKAQCPIIERCAGWAAVGAGAVGQGAGS